MCSSPERGCRRGRGVHVAAVVVALGFSGAVMALSAGPGVADTAGVQNAAVASSAANGARARSPAEDAAIAPRATRASAAHPPGYFGYGREPSAQQIAGWAIAVRPDGQGLPPGQGSVAHGADLFQQHCAMCHGTFGEGVGRYPKLTGGGKLTVDRPEKTVGNYWPYATTVWDYVNRAMPFYAPHTLPAGDVYAITAYMLNLNNIVPSGFVADAKSLPGVTMPNEDGFTWKDPRPDTDDRRCMSRCKDPSRVAIASTAEGKELTPHTTGPLDLMESQ